MPSPSEVAYARWASRTEPSAGGLALMAREADGFAYQPRIDLVLLVSDEDEVWIRASVDSVLCQAYGHVGLRVCDNGSVRPHVGEVLQSYAASDERVTLLRLSEKHEPAEAYNAALSEASGEHVAFMDAGDELAPNALFEIVELMQRATLDVVFADEDQIDAGGVRSGPVFKPYWSVDMLMATDYVGRLCVIRKSILDDVGGLSTGLDGAEEYDLMLRLAESTDLVYHLPMMLYHRRQLSSKASSGHTEPAGRKVLQDALDRRGQNAEVEPGLLDGSFRVKRRVGGTPEVGVIVTKPAFVDRISSLEELERKALHPVHEVVVAGVGDDPKPRSNHVGHPLAARAANLAAERVGGEYLAFVDARVREFSRGWLLEMLRDAQRPGVGAVGCKLLGRDGRTLRHGGSILEVGALTGFPREPVAEGNGYLPIVDYPLETGFAPAACMVVSRRLFELVGGFDDENVPTAFYDLDFSLRLWERKRRSVYTPHASVTFGGSRAMPDEDEIAYVWRRWWQELVRLFFYQQPPLARHELDRRALRWFPHPKPQPRNLATR